MILATGFNVDYVSVQKWSTTEELDLGEALI